jgi:hypothetical protein
VHTLPDGKQITVRGEGEWCAEALMQPGLLGEGTGGDLSDAVYGAAMACQVRRRASHSKSNAHQLNLSLGPCPPLEP